MQMDGKRKPEWQYLYCTKDFIFFNFKIFIEGGKTKSAKNI